MKKLIVGLGGLFFIVLIILLAGVRKRPTAVQSHMGGAADLVLSDISFVQTRNNLKDWELTAKEVRFYEVDQTAFLKDIVVAMESDDGTPLTLSGDHGRMEPNGKTFSIQRGEDLVSVQMGDHYAVKTASLRWSSEERVMQTEDPVLITGKGVSISGEGMRIVLDRSEITLMRNVRARMD